MTIKAHPRLRKATLRKATLRKAEIVPADGDPILGELTGQPILTESGQELLA